MEVPNGMATLFENGSYGSHRAGGDFLALLTELWGTDKCRLDVHMGSMRMTLL